MTQNYLSRFLDYASKMYYEGSPVISDIQFDTLADAAGYSKVGAKATPGSTVVHYMPLYSLQKFYPGEGEVPLKEYTAAKVTTPKLDGSAISLLYYNGLLIQAATRGDGIEGQDITDKMLQSSLVPTRILNSAVFEQITGEVVAPSHIKNARNYAAGALNLNSIDEFKGRDLYFVAYSTSAISELYTSDLRALSGYGFKTVEDTEFCEQFPQDGLVVRINDNNRYCSMGCTSKHPRGAFAVKERKQGIETTLLSVEWQTGKSGKVTPVAILEPVDIDGAIVSRATLNNVGFIKALDLALGDRVLVVRAGEIIPTIVAKVEATNP